MNLFETLKSKGYKMYRHGYTQPKQNADSRTQALRVLKTKDVIFVKDTNETTDTKWFYWQHDKYTDLSTMVFGGSDIRFVKDEDFDNEIIWGLGEMKKPPTLLYPRPSIKVKRYRKYGEDEYVMNEDQTRDDSMNLVLQKETPETIYKAMYDKSIVFEYDLT